MTDFNCRYRDERSIDYINQVFSRKYALHSHTCSKFIVGFRITLPI